MGYPYAEPGLEQEREYTIPRPDPANPGRVEPAARISAEPLEAVLAVGSASGSAAAADREPSSTDRSLMILADSRRQALARAEVAEERMQVLERRELKLAAVVGALLLVVGAATVAALDFGLRSSRLQDEAVGLREELTTVQAQEFDARTQVSEAGFALRAAELDHRERLADLADLDAALASERERRLRAEAVWAVRVVEQLLLGRR